MNSNIWIVKTRKYYLSATCKPKEFYERGNAIMYKTQFRSSFIINSIHITTIYQLTDFSW